MKSSKSREGCEKTPMRVWYRVTGAYSLIEFLITWKLSLKINGKGHSN